MAVPWAVLYAMLLGGVVSLILTAIACICARDRRPSPAVAAAAMIAGASAGWVLQQELNHGWHWRYTMYQDLPPQFGAAFALLLCVRAAVPLAFLAPVVDAVLAGLAAGIGCTLLWGHVDASDRPATLLVLAVATALLSAVIAMIVQAAQARIPAWVGRGTAALGIGALGAGLLPVTIDLGGFPAILAMAIAAPLALAFWTIPMSTSIAVATAALAWLATLAWMNAPWDHPQLVLIPTVTLTVLAMASGHLARVPALARRPRLAVVAVIAAAVLASGLAVAWANWRGVRPDAAGMME